MEEVNEFAVCIIQSLGADERQTGQNLYNDVLRLKTIQEEELTVELTNVATREEFFNALSDIEDKIVNEQWHVILHIEAHGGDDGVELSSGDVISWEELMDATRPINIALKNYLIIHLAMCNGAWILTCLDPEDRAPFRAIIATANPIGDRNLEAAFNAFYDEYLFSFDPEAGVDAMNAVLGENANKYYLLPVSGAFDGIVNPDRDPNHFRATVRALAQGEYDSNAEIRNIPFEEYLATREQEVRQDMAALAANKPFFMMG